MKILETMDYPFGEKRNVGIEIRDICKRCFEVTNYRWELRINDGIEDSGECELIEPCEHVKILNALIRPQINNAMYILRYYYDIYPEERYYDLQLRVRERRV